MSGTADIRQLIEELHTKNQQIRGLLSITQAINNNTPVEELIDMYRSFLAWEMNVQRMVLFIGEMGSWECAATIRYERTDLPDDIADLLLSYRDTRRVLEEHKDSIQDFDIIIPVYHQDRAIAFVLLYDGQEDHEIFSKIQFITTITNLIAVAIENRRLFRQQLEQERYQRDLELAATVQQMLIPDHMPRNESIELASFYQPHMNVGGDYIDYVEFEDGRYLLCIADVSGKGIAAALLMSNFQAYLSSQKFNYRSLKELVFILNKAIYNNTQGERFISLFICEYDPAAAQLKYINAGHPPPFLLREGVLERLDQGCTLLGVLPELPSVQEGILPIDGPALLLSYTDGLSDLKNDEGVVLSEAFLEEFILSHQAQSAELFCQALVQQIDRFREDQAYPDDIALLVAKILA